MRTAIRAATATALALALGLLAAAAVGPASASHPGAAPASSPTGPAASASVSRPPIVKRPIPFGPKRKREMAAYSERHYGQHRWRLRHPRVIVEHMADVADVELGELPNVCSHFVISPSGRILQLVNLRTRCRHTVGLNWTAIGIEHAGYADSDVLDDPRQRRASLWLTQYLRCRFGIKVRNVIGHNESFSSPYHLELVPSLKTQTHGDWKHASMQIYRRKLRRLGPC